LKKTREQDEEEPRIKRKFITFSSKPITSEASSLARSSAALHSSCAFAHAILADSSST
jgi:hypothetical protein